MPAMDHAESRAAPVSPARPVVTVSYAQTLDGRLATMTGSSQWISGSESLTFAHQLRASHDAIMVGVGTVCQDNPRLTVRLVPGQDDKAIAAEMERLMREAAPEGADVEIEFLASAPAALVRPDDPAIKLGQDAFEKVVGRRPLLLRVGGSLPVMAALEEKGVPTILTGFDLPEGNIHSPNERFRVDHIPLGVSAAQELYKAFAALR